MRKFWNWVKNEAGRTLYFDGYIAQDSWFDDDITPKKFKAELHAGAGDIAVWLNSPGGDVFAATQIYTMLREYDGKVTVKIDGLAASAASVIAMAGDEIILSPVAMMMIHNPATAIFGEAADLQTAIKMLGEVKESLLNAYELKTGLARSKLSSMMDAETWFSAQKAVELGFADTILYAPGEPAAAEGFLFDRLTITNALIGKMPKAKTEPKPDVQPGKSQQELLTRLQLLYKKWGEQQVNNILNLREKRAKLWDSTKAFLDSRRGETGLLSAEDTATYEKMEVDVVNLGKEIERLERQAVMDLELAKPTTSAITHRPSQEQDAEKSGRASNEYKAAFWKAMRNKTAFEVQNALQVGTDSEGGYLVPDEFERTLIEALQEENIFRQLATIITTSSGDRKIPVVASKGTASWVDEEGAIPEADDAFGQVSIGAYKLATMIKVSEELISDSVFNLEQYIAKEFGRRIGSKEEEAFFIGDGTGKPTGIFNATGGAGVGITAASASTLTIDEIMDLFYSLKAPYRKNSTFVTNDATVKVVRKLKDGSGQYLWQPSVTAGQPDTILNRPLKTSAYVPSIASAAKVMAFGDFGYYWVADRQGRSFQRLNELFAATGQVGFKATQRVDGKLILAEAIKVLQMKA